MIKKKLKSLVSALENMEASVFMHRLMWMLLAVDTISMVFRDGYSGTVLSAANSIIIIQMYIGGVICAKLEKMKG